jgi:ABC-2 type transport system permease protein
VGGLWIPVSVFPDWLRAVSHWTPTYRFGELGRSVAGGTAPGAGTVAVPAGWLAPLSESTVRNYLSAAIGKTGTRNRMEALRTARHNGWL